jgi:hypothetical protein
MLSGKADVTVHIDENLDPRRRQEVRELLCWLPGVAGVRNPDHTPHLMVVEYDPRALRSSDILRHVTLRGLHAELIGL